MRAIPSIAYRYMTRRPVALGVEITEKCNLRCRHCYFYKRLTQKSELSDQEWIDVLEKYRSYPLVCWCGGEPLLRRELLDEVHKLFSANWIGTNGTIPIPDYVNLAFVPLDGYGEAHDKLRGRKGLYSEVRNNIQCSSSSKKILVNCCITRTTMSSIQDLARDVSRLNVLGLAFGLYTSSNREDDELSIRDAERDKLIDDLLTLKEEYGDFIRATPDLLEKMRVLPKDTCGMRQFITTLDPRGRKKEECFMADCSECETFPRYLFDAVKMKSMGDISTMLRLLNFLRLTT